MKPFKGIPDNVSDPIETVLVALTASSTDNAYDGLTESFNVKCIEVEVPTESGPGCELISNDYTINYYTCALGQYNYHKTLPFRLGGSYNASNIREQSSTNTHKTFLGDQKS